MIARNKHDGRQRSDFARRELVSSCRYLFKCGDWKVVGVEVDELAVVRRVLVIGDIEGKVCCKVWGRVQRAARRAP